MIQQELKMCCKLTELSIYGNYALGTREVALVADLISSMDTLVSVKVSSYYIEEAGLNALTEAIRTTKRLEFLKIVGCSVSEYSLINLANAVMNNTSLESLEISETVKSQQLAWRFCEVVLMRVKPLYLAADPRYDAFIKFHQEKRISCTQIFAFMAGAASQSQNKSVRRFLRRDGDTRILRRVTTFMNCF